MFTDHSLVWAIILALSSVAGIVLADRIVRTQRDAKTASQLGFWIVVGACGAVAAVALCGIIWA
jgi:hypothetical protein